MDFTTAVGSHLSEQSFSNDPSGRRVDVEKSLDFQSLFYARGTFLFSNVINQKDEIIIIFYWTGGEVLKFKKVLGFFFGFICKSFFGSCFAVEVKSKPLFHSKLLLLKYCLNNT